MKRYDVAIVGAGPAGSTAAYFLAQEGIKVCLVDKQSFPRDKVCGDGVVSPILFQLERMGLSNWIEKNCHNAPKEVLLSSPDGEAVRILPDNRDICYGRVIPRMELDAAILRQAVTVGADLFEGVQLTEMTRQEPDRVRLIGSQRSSNIELQLESKIIITADGAHASFTNYLGLIKGQPDLVAIRGYFENVQGSESLLEIHFDSTVMPGYAWIFPMKDGQANVGLGTFIKRSRQRDINLKYALREFIKHNHFAYERLSQAQMIGPVKGYPLRSKMNTVTPFTDNIMVAGEAAGLVNPLNGEGIGTAMFSAELAAQYAKIALDVGDFSKLQLSGYAKALRKHIGRKHVVATILRKLLAWPGVMNRTVKRAQVDHDFAQTLMEVIVEVTPPTAMLTPSFIARLIAG